MNLVKHDELVGMGSEVVLGIAKTSQVGGALRVEVDPSASEAIDQLLRERRLADLPSTNQDDGRKPFQQRGRLRFSEPGG
jgi:hypothetical protein